MTGFAIAGSQRWLQVAVERRPVSVGVVAGVLMVVLAALCAVKRELGPD